MIKSIRFWENEILAALASKAEHNHLDFKAELSKDNGRLKEHINAFGNYEIGGCFVFGVKGFEAIGIDAGWDPIVHKISRLAHDTQDPPLNVRSFSIEINGKLLLCIYIQPSPIKPVFIKDRSPLGGEACFKRTGASTIAMSSHEIRDIIATSSEKYFDESSLEDVSINYFDISQLKKMIPKFDETEISSKNNIATLIDNRIFCEPKSHPGITVAGWLIFAEQPQNYRLFRNAYIEFQIFQGKMRDTVIKKQEIKGSLPKQIENAIDVLMQHVWVMPKIQGARRQDIPAYSPEILREVITNSLVHRDYTRMHQPVKISLFSDHIEIENPGGLMPGLTPLNLIHRREWRNPLLADLMRKFGYGDMDGEGIDRLYSATRAIKVPAPILIDNKTSFKVILSGPKKYEDFTAQEKRLTVIILLITEESIDNQSIRNAFGISSEKASTLIKSLIDEKIIETSSKSRKYAKYTLTENYREKIFG